MSNIFKPKSCLFFNNISLVWSICSNFKLYFILGKFWCCIRNGFNSAEIVSTVSRGDWRASQMSRKQQRRQTDFTNIHQWENPSKTISNSREVAQEFPLCTASIPFFRVLIQAKYSIIKTQNGILHTKFIFLKQNC